MDENARLREALADMVALFSADNVLLKGTHLNSTLKLARIALTPAPEAPKGGEGGLERIWAAMPIDGVMKDETLYGWTTAEHLADWQSENEAEIECGCDDPLEYVEYVRADLVATPGADFKAGMLRAVDLLTTWTQDIRQSVLECMDLHAEEERYAVIWLENFAQAITEVLAEAEKITSSDAGGEVAAVQTPQPGGTPASSVPAPLTLRAGKRYRDGNGQVKGPLHSIFWENGEEMLTDSYVVWHPDGTLAGGTREDKRSLVAEVGDAG